MQLVILCGGIGRRLMPLTAKTPKSMIRISGKPFLQRQLELAKKYGIRDVVLLTGYLQGQIIDYFGNGKKFGLNIAYSRGSQKNGGGLDLKKAQPLLENEFLLMYGDAYLRIDYSKVFDYFLSKKKLGLMVVYKNYNKYDRSNVTVRNGFVTKYDLDAKKNRKKYVFIDYGLSALRKDALSLVPKVKKYPLGQLFKSLAKRRELLCYKAKNRFYEIGSPEGLASFQEFFSKREDRDNIGRNYKST